MAFKNVDRVRDTTFTNGTGAIAVSGSAPATYQNFSLAFGVGDTFWGCIAAFPVANAGSGLNEWEVGLYTYSALNTVTRTTVLNSSAGIATPCTFTAGAKDVFTIPVGTNATTGGLQISELNVTGTDVSSSPTSGALTVAGGVGIAGALFVGGNPVVIGSTASLAVSGLNQQLQSYGTTLATGGVSLGMFNATAATAAHIDFYRSEGASIGSATVVASGDVLGDIYFWGAQQSGTFATQNAAARISCQVDGTVTSGAGADMPGALFLYTTPDGSGTPSERVRIDHFGQVTIGGFAPQVSAALALVADGTTAGSGTMNIAYSAFNTANFCGAQSYYYSNNDTLGGQTAVTNTQDIGIWDFYGSDGTDFRRCCEIRVQADATFTAGSSPGKILFKTTPSGTSSTVSRLTLDNGGGVIVGSAAISTSATTGFLYIPTCAGTPTGVPRTYTGCIAMVYDTTNHQFWFYDSGWKQPKTPAGAATVTWQ